MKSNSNNGRRASCALGVHGVSRVLLLVIQQNIESFYECGTDILLSDNEIGKDETYYLHTLKYYIPIHAKQTWKNHKCKNWKIGVFTMQGFERRNKKS